MNTYQNLLVSIEASIASITINREAKLNALNAQTIQELQEALTDALENTEVRGIILTGAGEKAFVAGADIKEFVGLTQEQAVELATRVQTELMDRIATSHKPIVAAINGFALGGGLELAMACQLRIAAEHAKVGLPETSLGIIPAYGGTQRLTHLVGQGRALEIILTGDMLNAARAYEIGLVNAVVPMEQLKTAAEALLRKIFRRSPFAIAAAIEAVNASLEASRGGYQAEIAAFGRCAAGPEFVEGVQAFLEKRPANF